jgi:hypothetical protein
MSLAFLTSVSVMISLMTNVFGIVASLCRVYATHRRAAVFNIFAAGLICLPSILVDVVAVYWWLLIQVIDAGIATHCVAMAAVLLWANIAQIVGVSLLAADHLVRQHGSGLPWMTTAQASLSVLGAWVYAAAVSAMAVNPSTSAPLLCGSWVLCVTQTNRSYIGVVAVTGWIAPFVVTVSLLAPVVIKARRIQFVSIAGFRHNATAGLAMIA